LRSHSADGAFVVVCGSDGVGKSTLIDSLSRYLAQRKISSAFTHFPSDFIRDYPPFADYRSGNRGAYSYRAIAMIAMADRIQLCDTVIESALNQNKLVVSDRYVYSGLARLAMHGNPCDSWFVESCRHLLRPKVVFLLHADEGTIRSRLTQRNYEMQSELLLNETLEMQRHLLQMAGLNGFHVVDTTRDSADVVLNEQVLNRLRAEGIIAS
jgi:dTMP kinase